MSDPSPVEDERRWLVLEVRRQPLPRWEAIHRYDQGYLISPTKGISGRIRIIDGTYAEGTVKYGKGRRRRQMEDDMPLDLAEALYNEMCRHRVSKDRHKYDGWEYDVFRGPLKGIIILERENPEDDLQLPSYVAKAIEVTDTLSSSDLARLATKLKDTGKKPLPYVLRLIRRRTAKKRTNKPLI